ncbi:hypothetical protein DFA_00035 [Cavenderia fasciculata]|uniref:Uncharacterized protein n=1 Tax=Cavenderia fasciculata TaxID=261658 RepID=F4PXE8_CACFS|nr:uncharacterized protein DFA_00035 [Cavenderia fasciculata]EGG19458.1 hypothetical protein DFA_00035 [Cavenderia fasciculata]|eukprot:XP_004357752.1 hypothetical protein DFA_00035 [Cavenderia fasciculata]
MTSSNSNKETCEKLLTEYFDEYTLLTQLRSQLNDALKNGYFLITKSRNTMGLKSLGQLQYPENMKPTIKLEIPKDGYNIDNVHNEISYHEIQTDIKKNNNNNNNGNNNNNNNNNNGNNETGENESTTRRRTKFNKEPEISVDPKTGTTTMGSIERLLSSSSIDQESDSDSDSDDENNDDNSDDNENNNGNENSGEKKSTPRKPKRRTTELKANPIFWFGYLTPATLKQSQLYFKQVVIGLVLGLASASDPRCLSQLAPYFNGQKQRVQMTVVMPNGNVVFTRNDLYYFPQGHFLTNGDSFSVVTSDNEDCANSKVQPFAETKPSISFYDRSGIVLNQDGTCSMTPLWKDPSSPGFNLELQCSPSGMNYAWSNDHFFAFNFKAAGSKTGEAC